MNRPIRLMVIAGETSGDMHAAGLVRAIGAKSPRAEFFGIGGDALRAAGMEILHDTSEMAVMGIAEVAPKLLFFRRVFLEMLAVAAERRPDAVLLVDYPDFNLRFAAAAHKLGLKVIYYVCPQVWAWRRKRIATMARVIDRLIVIFPFEPAVFAGTGLKVDYVGHPLIDEAERALAEPKPDLPWRGNPRLALLPGSRRHVIRRMVPVFARAAALLLSRHPSVGIILPAPSEEAADIIRAELSQFNGPPLPAEITVGLTRQVLRTADAALVASGTATVETALMGCPMVISYKTSSISFTLMKRLVHLQQIGMVNIIAGRQLCAELIQDAATPRALADAADVLLSDQAARERMLAGYREVAEKLGPGGANERAAAVVLEELARNG